MTQKGDFLVCRLNPKHNFLMRTTSVRNGTISGFAERDYHIPKRRVEVEVSPKDVLLNLGSDPHPGTVYGVDITRHLGTKHHDAFGNIHFFYKIPKDVGRNLMEAYDKVEKIFTRNKLDFVLGDGVWEVMATKGQLGGMYKRSKKPDLNPHRFLVYPEIAPPTELPYILCHELSHHLHSEFLTSPNVNAAWIKLFNTTIKPIAVPKEKAVALLRSLEAHDGPPSSLGSTLDEDDTRAYRLVLQAISKYHAVTVKELDTLHESGNLEEISAIWPKRSIPSKELAPVVSEYACKNFRELIAESVSFYLVGKKLPREVTALVEKSLSYARKVSSR